MYTLQKFFSYPTRNGGKNSKWYKIPTSFNELNAHQTKLLQGSYFEARRNYFVLLHTENFSGRINNVLKLLKVFDDTGHNGNRNMVTAKKLVINCRSFSS